jgi:hypothetical protein
MYVRTLAVRISRPLKTHPLTATPHTARARDIVVSRLVAREGWKLDSPRRPFLDIGSAMYVRTLAVRISRPLKTHPLSGRSQPLGRKRTAWRQVSIWRGRTPAVWNPSSPRIASLCISSATSLPTRAGDAQGRDPGRRGVPNCWCSPAPDRHLAPRCTSDRITYRLAPSVDLARANTSSLEPLVAPDRVPTRSRLSSNSRWRCTRTRSGATRGSKLLVFARAST